MDGASPHPHGQSQSLEFGESHGHTSWVIGVTAGPTLARLWAGNAHVEPVPATQAVSRRTARWAHTAWAERPLRRAVHAAGGARVCRPPVSTERSDRLQV